MFENPNLYGVNNFYFSKTKVFLKSFHAEALSKRLTELTRATITVQAGMCDK